MMRFSGVVLLCALLSVSQGSPIPGDATGQEVANDQKISSEESPILPNDAHTQISDGQSSNAEGPVIVNNSPANNVEEAVLASKGESGSVVNTKTSAAIGEKFVKEVLQMFFADLKKHPDIVEKLMKHLTEEIMIQESQLAMMDYNVLPQSEQLLTADPNAWEDVVLIFPEDQQLQQQQLQLTPEQSPTASDSASQNDIESAKRQPNAQTQQQNQQQQQQLQQQPLQNPQQQQPQQGQQTQQLQGQQILQQPVVNMPQFGSPAVKGAVKSGPNTYYVYPMVPAQGANGVVEGYVPVGQQGVGLDPRTEILYDGGVPDYYYYFYYDNDDESDIVDPVKTNNDVPGSTKGKNNANTGDKVDTVNADDKIIEANSHPEGKADEVVSEKEPEVKETKSDKFSGESTKELPPSADDLNPENDLIKLHN